MTSYEIDRTQRVAAYSTNGRCRRDSRPTRGSLPRYNDPVEYQRARHIGEIIRERDNLSALGLTAPSSPKRDVLKIPRLLLGGTLDVLATIGWFVTLPFITCDDRALIARAQSGG
jgi:hypothetical protein